MSENFVRPVTFSALPAGVARIAVFDDVAKAQDAWRILEKEGAFTGYQARGFGRPAIEKFAALRNESPMIIVAYDVTDAPLLLCPLVLARRGGALAAIYPGAKHANFNAPLVRDGYSPTADDCALLLRAAARMAPVAPDYFMLLNQPRRWKKDNCFAALPGGLSPSTACGVRIAKDNSEFWSRMDAKDARKKTRYRMSKLTELGDVVFERAQSPQSIRKILDAFYIQKSARLTQMRIEETFEDAPTRSLIEAMALADKPALELYALRVGDVVIATFGGLPHGADWHGLFNSYDQDPKYSRSSPGELMLRHMLRDLEARGFEHFDLGVGEARYKTSICDETYEMRDAFVAISPLGHIVAPAQRAKQSLKRRIKQNPRAFEAAKKIRAMRP